MARLPKSLTLGDGELVLRDWHERDAPAIESVCGDWNVCQFTTVPWEYTLNGARAWIRRQQERRSTGTGLALAITNPDEPDPVGNVNLVRFTDDGDEAALGYWLVPAARGHGRAVRAAQLLCNWGFSEFGLQRIELAILPDNRASHAVARRLGAVPEGLRQDSHAAGGQLLEMMIYSLPNPGRQHQGV